MTQEAKAEAELLKFLDAVRNSFIFRGTKEEIAEGVLKHIMEGAALPKFEQLGVSIGNNVVTISNGIYQIHQIPLPLCLQRAKRKDTIYHV